MILLIHKNEINLKNHLITKNVEKLESIGEMNFFIGTSVPLKDEVIIPLDYRSNGVISDDVLFDILNNFFNSSSLVKFSE